MGWIKALAIVVAVFLVFGVISTVWHFVYLAIIAAAIVAAIAGALKARAKLRAAKEARENRVEAKARARQAKAVPAAPRQADPSADAMRRQQSVEDELVRLRNEMQ
jgi:uncharacterized membrane protein YraQ (UPF0718 family)